MIKDNLGDRMKKYEAVSKTTLVSRMPVIIRLDGCHFHTVTRGFKKPFDEVMIKTMQDTMKYLCENIQGCVLGYTQSDEITLVLIDYKKLNSDAWFDNEVQKMASVSAAMATYAFNKFFKENTFAWADGQHTAYLNGLVDDDGSKQIEVYKKVIEHGAYFDSRAFNVPREDVTNCLLWRQKDAERNSINSLAQSLFSHKSLQGLKLKDTLIKIEQEGGVVWGNLPTTYKRGSCCIKDVKFILPDGQKVQNNSNITYNGTEGTFYWDEDGYYFVSPAVIVQGGHAEKLEVKETSKWIIDNDIPRFNENRKYIEELVYPKEEE